MSKYRKKRTCFLCSRSNVPGSNIIFHKFPKDPTRKKLWCQACNLSDTIDDVHTLLICSTHFEPKDYLISIITDQPMCLLNKSAVPHVNLGLKLSTSTSSSVVTTFDQTSCLVNQDPQDLELDIKEVVIGEPFMDNFDVKKVVIQDSFVRDKAIKTAEYSASFKLGKYEPHCANKIETPDDATSKRAGLVFPLLKSNAVEEPNKIKTIQHQILQVCKQITSFKALILHLRKKDFLSEEAGATIMEILPTNVKHLVAWKLRNKGKYSPSCKSFALILNFYSSRAYNYVREIWDNLLPHPSVIMDWYKVTDGRPGFTAEALEAISARVKGKSVFCNIIMDEMAIDEQLLFNQRFYGGVDYGCSLNIDKDNIPLARSALVFMVVALNENWKMPVAYFLINNLNGRERANILNQCIDIVERTGVEVHSVTFDGLAASITMFKSLGANFTYGSNFGPHFIREENKKKIFIFYDLRHMITLIRNTLGDKRLLQNNTKYIKWEFIEKLFFYQNTNDILTTNKLTKKHIDFQNNRMDIKLAMQTLSNTVSAALESLHECKVEEFKECAETARFCKIFNDISDILNCKNVFSGVNLNEENYYKLKAFAKEAENYIVQLTDENNTPILKSGRKTGFLGIIVDLKNMFKLYSVLNKKGVKRLLTSRLSQDFIKTFFEAIRSFKDFNPNAMEFQSAYKRLVLHHEGKEIESETCTFKNVGMLCISASTENASCDTFDNVKSDTFVEHSFDLDYVLELSPSIEIVEAKDEL